MSLQDLLQGRMPRIFDRLRGGRDPSLRLGKGIPTIGVASGKGGTGKTFCTVNLGVLLAGERERVTVLDADLGLGNAHLLLGLRPTKNLQDFLEERSGLRELLQVSKYGVDVLPGGSGISRLCQLEDVEMRRLARSLSGELPRARTLLVDSAAGISPQTLKFLIAADLVLLVVTPEVTSLTDAYAMIKCLHLRGMESRIAVLVNRADDEGQALEAMHRVQEVAKRFLDLHVEGCGWVPEDPAVRGALASRIPIVVRAPHAPASRGLRLCAQRLEEMLIGLPARRTFPSRVPGRSASAFSETGGRGGRRRRTR